MKPVPEVLVGTYAATCKRKSEPQAALGAYLGWLRFYLDFCFKYREPPRDADSLQPFLQKLASKNQSAAKQEQAARAIGLYYETMRGWSPEQGGISNIQHSISKDEGKTEGGATSNTTAQGPGMERDSRRVAAPADKGSGTVNREPETVNQHPPSDWDEVFRRLKEEIRLRQYSPKTLATYIGAGLNNSECF